MPSSLLRDFLRYARTDFNVPGAELARDAMGLVAVVLMTVAVGGWLIVGGAS